ncbi:MAG: hypothetical protein Q4E05_03495, partial [Pseudoclavibacter sp.]|nr:hypothetical protein [Pseudoclavibacter sp.]
MPPFPDSDDSAPAARGEPGPRVGRPGGGRDPEHLDARRHERADLVQAILRKRREAAGAEPDAEATGPGGPGVPPRSAARARPRSASGPDPASQPPDTSRTVPMDRHPAERARRRAARDAGFFEAPVGPAA